MPPRWLMRMGSRARVLGQAWEGALSPTPPAYASGRTRQADEDTRVSRVQQAPAEEEAQVQYPSTRLCCGSLGPGEGRGESGQL